MARPASKKKKNSAKTSKKSIKIKNSKEKTEAKKPKIKINLPKSDTNSSKKETPIEKNLPQTSTQEEKSITPKKKIEVNIPNKEEEKKAPLPIIPFGGRFPGAGDIQPPPEPQPKKSIKISLPTFKKPEETKEEKPGLKFMTQLKQHMEAKPSPSIQSPQPSPPSTMPTPPSTPSPAPQQTPQPTIPQSQESRVSVKISPKPEVMEEDISQEVKDAKKKMQEMREEITKVIVGQKDVINAALICLIANGHALLEGAPGLAKTLLVRTLSQCVREATFKRIQFTPDLLPADITGITGYRPGGFRMEESFYVVKGPIFANFILADEINRAPPKVQSAMLEAMQERKVTIGKETFSLPQPFLVLATQNPLEQMGVYPLPEAQLDRFLFKVYVDYPSEEEETKILEQNVEVKKLFEFNVRPILTPAEIMNMQELVKKIYISEEIKNYIVKIVSATRRPEKYHIGLGKYIRWGASPRASIWMFIASKANALLNGRDFVTPEDVRFVAPSVLRHRIILNYEGKAKEIRTGKIVEDILNTIDIP